MLGSNPSADSVPNRLIKGDATHPLFTYWSRHLSGEASKR